MITQLKYLLLIVILAFPGMAEAQITIQGTTTDAGDNQVLPYVNIGIRNKNLGAVSGTDGKFLLTIPAVQMQDTLTFSMVGYEDLQLPLSNTGTYKGSAFRLRQKVTELGAAVVTAGKMTERRIGITESRPLIRLVDASVNQQDIFEIAQLVKLDSGLSKITSVNLLINETNKDSGTFRINFYGFDGRLPTARIIEKNITRTMAVREGWLSFDLSREGIYVKGSFVVAIEFIPRVPGSGSIKYEAKLGGRTKSFVRTSSQGGWGMPPHHYRMYVTALVNDTKKKHINEDDKETPATTVLYSQHVKDSFYIFIHLPKGYKRDRQKRYPVVCVLDANAYFDHLAEEMVHKKTGAILVGIGYRHAWHMDSMRDRDYTYPVASAGDGFARSGGANDFLQFIAKELLPYIDCAYRTDTAARTLMGHSLGGYFPLYVLLQQLEGIHSLFRHYVAASPSLGYADGYLARRYHALDNKSKSPVSLFMTWGEREDAEEGTGTRGIDGFNLFVQLLSKKQSSGLQLGSHIYPGYGHMETAIPTFTEALKKLE